MGQDLLHLNKFPYKEITNALNKLSWKLLKRELDKLNWKRDLDVLLNTVARNDALIIRRSNVQRTQQRQSLFDEMIDYAQVNHSPAAGLGFTKLLEWFTVFDECFKDILDLEGQSDAVKQMRPVERVWAALEWYTRDYENLSEQTHQLFIKEPNTLVTSFSLEGANGGRIDPGTYHVQQVKALGSAILMESYRDGWFDRDGYVVIPELCEVAEEQVLQAGSIFLGANSWASVEEMQQQVRYLGRDCRLLRSNDFRDPPDDLKYMLVFGEPTQAQFLDYIATERTSQRELSNFFEFESDPNMGKVLKALKPFPGGENTRTEIHAATSLSTLLNYDITLDDGEYLGLTLDQWVRGYAALRGLAVNTVDDKKIQSVVLTYSSDDLIGCLKVAGLSLSHAMRFIANVTFHRDSRDLFDSPLIRMSDGYVVILDIVKNAAISRAIASNILSREGEFKLKGAALEEKLRNVFRRQGFPVASVRKVFADGEYEYDALVLWDRKLFVFECKNRWLSEGRPVAIFNRSNMMRDDIAQLGRLVKGLKKYPEIITQAFGKGIEYDEIIPCLVSGLPQALPEKINGIYFSDTSIISRFFSSRYFSVDTFSSQLTQSENFYDQWGGDIPTSDKFVLALEKPVQVLAVLKATEVSDIFVTVGSSIYMRIGMFHSRAMTADEYTNIINNL